MSTALALGVLYLLGLLGVYLTIGTSKPEKRTHLIEDEEGERGQLFGEADEEVAGYCVSCGGCVSDESYRYCPDCP